MTQVSVRKMRAGDGPACARLWVAFGRALAQRMPDQFFEPPIDGLAERFEDLIADADDMRLRALALAGDQAVGLVHAVVRAPTDPPDLSLMRDPPGTRVWIEDVVVLQEWRGQGIGERLVAWAGEWGAARGANTVMLNSDPDGPARRFYERIGFRAAAALYVKAL